MICRAQIFLVCLVLAPPLVVGASPDEDLDQLERQQEEMRREIDRLRDEVERKQESTAEVEPHQALIDPEVDLARIALGTPLTEWTVARRTAR
jgi:hypothetical protein